MEFATLSFGYYYTKKNRILQEGFVPVLTVIEGVVKALSMLPCVESTLKKAAKGAITGGDQRKKGQAIVEANRKLNKDQSVPIVYSDYK